MMNLVKKDICAFCEVDAQEFEGRFNPFIIFFLEEFPVQRVFKVEEQLVFRANLFLDEVEDSGLAGPPHSGEDYRFRRSEILVDLFQDISRKYHNPILHLVELFVNHNITFSQTRVKNSLI